MGWGLKRLSEIVLGLNLPGNATGFLGRKHIPFDPILFGHIGLGKQFIPRSEEHSFRNSDQGLHCLLVHLHV